MKPFAQSRPLIENEFENAHFDPATGLDADTLFAHLVQMQETPTDEARPIVCARAFAYLLDNVQLEINEHTPFSVKINTGVDYSYFASQDIFYKALYREQRRKVLREQLPNEYAIASAHKEIGLGHPGVDFWHTVPDWNYLLPNGFSGILQNATNSKARWLARGDARPEQISFLDSVILRYEAILRLLARIYEYSLGFAVPEFSACIQHLISAPPATLYEVMQFSVLYLYFEEIGVERGRTLGPIDLLYAPFAERMLKNGEVEEMKELFRYFFLHFTAAKRFAQEPFTLGGSSADGKDRSNFLTHMILDLYDELNIYDPKIHLRYHKNLDDAIMRKVLAMIRGGNSSICIVNDEAVYQGYERIGIPRSEAQNYVILGCYEPIIMGLEEGEIAPHRFNMTKCLELAINGGRDILTERQIGDETPLDVPTFEAFFELFLKHLDDMLDFDLDYIQKQGRISTLINPSTIYSSSFADCIEKGMDVHEYPLKYNNLSIKPFGLATVVDSLVAIQKLVYDQGVLTLDEMRRALKADWQGYEELRETIVNDRDKYGNNRPLPDAIMTRITTHLADRYCGMELARGGKLRIGLDSVYHCVQLAGMASATPNGRHAGEPISKNLCASDGMDRGGITAYMQSVLKIDSSAYLCGLPLDFMLHPSAVNGEKGLADFLSLMKIFFANGGFAVQGNVVLGETLREAQLHPERYSTLQVRVCGWNEYFVKLSRVKQDMFIKQCEVLGS